MEEGKCEGDGRSEKVVSLRNAVSRNALELVTPMADQRTDESLRVRYVDCGPGLYVVI